MPTTVTHSGLLLLFYESIVTPDPIDGDSIIYFGKYGMPQGYFPATYWPITVNLDLTTPACRTFTVVADGTGSSVGVEPMGFLMLFASLVVTGTPTGRTYSVLSESRTYTVSAESRTYTVEKCTDDD